MEEGAVSPTIDVFTVSSGYDWAEIHLNEATGLFMAYSTFGTFAHRWNARGGATLRKFLQDLHPDYFFGKTCPEHQVFDADKTIAEAKEWVEDEETAYSKEAQELILDEFGSMDACSNEAELMHNLSNYPRAELAIMSTGLKYVQNPQCTGFWEKLWPLFLEQSK